MNITLPAYGSRGDVQPFLALAVGLQNDGHEVILAAPHRFTGLITAQHKTPVPYPATRRRSAGGSMVLAGIH